VVLPLPASDAVQEEGYGIVHTSSVTSGTVVVTLRHDMTEDTQPHAGTTESTGVALQLFIGRAALLLHSQMCVATEPAPAGNTFLLRSGEVVPWWHALGAGDGNADSAKLWIASGSHPAAPSNSEAPTISVLRMPRGALPGSRLLRCPPLACMQLGGVFVASLPLWVPRPQTVRAASSVAPTSGSVVSEARDPARPLPMPGFSGLEPVTPGISAPGNSVLSPETLLTASVCHVWIDALAPRSSEDVALGGGPVLQSSTTASHSTFSTPATSGPVGDVAMQHILRWQADGAGLEHLPARERVSRCLPVLRLNLLRSADGWRATGAVDSSQDGREPALPPAAAQPGLLYKALLLGVHGPLHLSVADTSATLVLHAFGASRHVFAALAAAQAQAVAQHDLLSGSQAAGDAQAAEALTRWRRLYDSSGLPQPLVLVDRLSISGPSLEVTASLRAPVHLSLQQLRLRYAGLRGSSIACSPERLLREVIASTITDTLLQLPAMLGSLDLLGNPSGLVRRVAAGISWSLRANHRPDFEAGLDGSLQGRASGMFSALTAPARLLGRVAVGGASITASVAEGLLQSMSAVTLAASRNLSDVLQDVPVGARRGTVEAPAASAAAAVGAGVADFNAIAMADGAEASTSDARGQAAGAAAATSSEAAPIHSTSRSGAAPTRGSAPNLPSQLARVGVSGLDRLPRHWWQAQQSEQLGGETDRVAISVGPFSGSAQVPECEPVQAVRWASLAPTVLEPADRADLEVGGFLGAPLRGRQLGSPGYLAAAAGPTAASELSTAVSRLGRGLMVASSALAGAPRAIWSGGGSAGESPATHQQGGGAGFPRREGAALEAHPTPPAPPGPSLRTQMLRAVGAPLVGGLDFVGHTSMALAIALSAAVPGASTGEDSGSYAAGATSAAPYSPGELLTLEMQQAAGQRGLSSGTSRRPLLEGWMYQVLARCLRGLPLKQRPAARSAGPGGVPERRSTAQPGGRCDGYPAFEWRALPAILLRPAHHERGGGMGGASGVGPGRMPNAGAACWLVLRRWRVGDAATLERSPSSGVAGTATSHGVPKPAPTPIAVLDTVSAREVAADVLLFDGALSRLLLHAAASAAHRSILASTGPMRAGLTASGGHAAAALLQSVAPAISDVALLSLQVADDADAAGLLAPRPGREPVSAEPIPGASALAGHRAVAAPAQIHGTSTVAAARDSRQRTPLARTAASVVDNPFLAAAATPAGGRSAAAAWPYGSASAGDSAGQQGSRVPPGAALSGSGLLLLVGSRDAATAVSAAGV
jgi:hypothetical protein